MSRGHANTNAPPQSGLNFSAIHPTGTGLSLRCIQSLFTSNNQELTTFPPAPYSAHFYAVIPWVCLETAYFPQRTRRSEPIAAKMKSMQRQFGKLQKRSENQADVGAVLAEFTSTSNMLDKVRIGQTDNNVFNY